MNHYRYQVFYTDNEDGNIAFMHVSARSIVEAAHAAQQWLDDLYMTKSFRINEIREVAA